jgi:ATP-binding cassette subfamily B protein
LAEFRNQGKTMVVIAHRLSTIANSDEILVMKNGKIIEQGNHQELISKDSIYSQMWEKQSVSLN